MSGEKEKFLEEKTHYLKKLERIEQEIDRMEKGEITARAACSLTCKICQCLECAKIPGGDV